MTSTRNSFAAVTAAVAAAAVAISGAVGLALPASAAPIPPTAVDHTADATVGTPITVDLAAGADAGSGHLVAAVIADADAGLGDIPTSVDAAPDGTIPLTVTPIDAGTHAVAYQLVAWTPGETVSADGDLSAPATVTVTVAPEAAAEPQPVDPQLAGYTAPRLQGDAYESWYERYTNLWNGGSDGDLCIDPTVGLYRPTVAEHAAYGGRATPVALTVRRTVDSIDALPVTIDVLDHPCAAAWGITSLTDHSVPGVDTGWDVSADGRGVTLREVPRAGAYGLLVQGVGPVGVQVVVRVRDAGQPDPEPQPQLGLEPQPQLEPEGEPHPDPEPASEPQPQPSPQPVPAPGPSSTPIALRSIETDVVASEQTPSTGTQAAVAAALRLMLGARAER